MGIETMRYKITGWVYLSIFLWSSWRIMGGNIVGYIEPAEVAFDGREMGVFMVLMAILGGKGTLWGPVIGAFVFHIFKEGFWSFLLGWQYVALRSFNYCDRSLFPGRNYGLSSRKKTR